MGAIPTRLPVMRDDYWFPAVVSQHTSMEKDGTLEANVSSSEATLLLDRHEEFVASLNR